MNIQKQRDLLKVFYSNGALSRSEKRQLKVVVDELREDRTALEVLRKEAFEMVRASLSNFEDQQKMNFLEGVIKCLDQGFINEFDRAETFFSPERDCAPEIVKLLRQARKSVDICVFTITDNRVSDAIVETAVRLGQGAVRIITDDAKAEDLGSDIRRFSDEGIEVKTDHNPAHMHHKFALFDDDTLLFGSYNWTVSADRSNNEDMAIVTEKRLVGDFRKEFDRLWARFKFYGD